MDMLTPVLAATSTITWLAANSANIAWAAIGLGMVIFFHELGHFAVAKWCNVNVERFSIGFGPILLSRKWGETEYALSLIPFGGYVKMLGQDDADPSQLTNEEIAQDPRSYLAKNVFQRMAIISAGVTMNVITAILFVGGAFAMGVKMPPGVIGDVYPGMPAWKAGLMPDDTIDKINGQQILTFQDVHQNIALSGSPLVIEGHRHDNTPFQYEIQPEKGSALPRIGVVHARSLTVWNDPKGKVPHVSPGTPAANANPPFQRGDLVTAINGTPVATYWEMRQQLAKKAVPEVTVDVRRADGTKAEVIVKDNFFRTLGLSMDAGPIGAIQNGSPAEIAKLEVGDKMAVVNGKKVGIEIDPLKLPNLFASLHGQDVEVTVIRQPKEGAQTENKITIRPLDLPGWTDQPSMEGEPITIPSIGVSFHTIPVVMAVEPGSPADQKGIKIKSITKVKKMELLLPEAVKDDYEKQIYTIEFDDPNKEAVSNNWGFAFWKMQEMPQRTVRLTLVTDQKESIVDLTPVPDPEWPMPVITGLATEWLVIELKAKTLGDAWDMSAIYTRNSAMNIYMTLRSLVTGRVPLRELRGPIGIAQTAVEIADVGLPQLLLFLGFLSINLAVLNFLPIPVLDGGHMVFLLWEAVTRRRPSERVMIGATYVGMAFLLSLMAFVLFLDVFVHPFKK